MNINFADVIMVAVLAIFVALIYLFDKYVKPYFESLTNHLDLTLEGEAIESLKKWVGVFVKAAEMTFKESGKGKEKKEYVIEALKALGFEVGATEDAIIESEVYVMNSEKVAENA